MNEKILKITRKIPQVTSLPDGHYFGTWTGKVIELDYQGDMYEIETETTSPGLESNVVIEIKDGEGRVNELLN